MKRKRWDRDTLLFIEMKTGFTTQWIKDTLNEKYNTDNAVKVRAFYFKIEEQLKSYKQGLFDEMGKVFEN